MQNFLKMVRYLKVTIEGHARKAVISFHLKVHLDRLLHYTTKISNIFSFAVANNRLSSEALHFFNVKKSLVNAAKKLDENGYSLLHSGLDQVFSHKLDYKVDVEKCTLDLFVSLPVTKKGLIFKLYKLRQTPLSIKHQSYHLDFSENEDFLAISDDLKYFRIISHSNIQSDQCDKFGTTYICKNSHISYPFSRMGDFCLGALWISDFSLALQHCKMSIYHPRPFIQEIFKNEFVVYSPTKIDGKKICYKNGAPVTEHLFFEGRRELKVEDFCTVETDFFKVDNWMSTSDEVVNPTLTYYNWGKGLESFFHNSSNFKNLTLDGLGKRNFLHELQKAKNTLQNAQILDNAAQNKANISLMQSYRLPTIFTWSSVTFFIIIFIIIVGVYTCKNHYRLRY